jgi:hypothetical protein
MSAFQTGERSSTDDFSRPAPLGPRTIASLATVRSGVMLKVAYELAASKSWPDRQVAIDLKAQGASEWAARLYASDGWDAVADVLAGRADIAIINPACAVTSAARRPGGDVAERAAIATVPSYDQLGIAVLNKYDLTTVEDFVAARIPMTVSLRGARPNHSVHIVLEDALAAAGTSLDEMRGWGCEISYDQGLAQEPVRTGLMRERGVDAVIDEGIYHWCRTAVESGYHFLDFGPDALARLEALGYRRGVLWRDMHPELPRDVVTLDHGGFLIYSRADASDGLIEPFCEALYEARDSIEWEGGPSLPLRRMVNDAVDAPLPIPLHPAADRVWRRHGLIGSGPASEG